MLSLLLVSALAATPTPFTLTSGEVTFEITAPLDTIRGASRSVKGSITLDPDNWADKPSAKIEIDLSSFRTGIDLRDEDLRDQFFEVSKYTRATLTVTALERPSAAKLTKGATAEAFARATLSLHGVEQEIIFPIKLVYDDEMSRTSLGVSAAFMIPLEQFAIKRPQRLLFKLGKDVKVVVRGRLRGPAPAPTNSDSTTTTMTTTAAAETEPPPPEAQPPVVARKPPEPVAPPVFVFKADTLEGRGERAFVDAGIGGSGNAVSCSTCHSIHDERNGLVDPKTKTIPPASSMWGVAHRPSWWRGVGRSAPNAASICARMFMLRNDNLAPEVEAALQAWFARISFDAAPPHDYAGVLMAKSRSLSASTSAVFAGDGKKGQAMVQRTCVRCHGKGKVRPELTPGLYSKDLVVSLVRGMGGNQQMPAYGLDRITDSELADMVAWLADERQQIFQRRKTGAAKN